MENFAQFVIQAENLSLLRGREGECLTVVWSSEKWKPYVLDQLCQVYTDHEAIYWLWYKAELSGRLI